MERLGTVRALIFRAGMSILILALSLLANSAAALSFEEGAQEASELNKTVSKKANKVKNNSTDCIITKNEKTARSKILPHEITTKHLFAVRTVLGEVPLRAERARSMIPAPVMLNNYGMALDEYLTLVNTLQPEPYLPQKLQPHANPFLKQTNPLEGSLSPADFSAPLQEEPHFNSKHNKQRVVNRMQTGSVLYLDS